MDGCADLALAAAAAALVTGRDFPGGAALIDGQDSAQATEAVLAGAGLEALQRHRKNRSIRKIAAVRQA